MSLNGWAAVSPQRTEIPGCCGFIETLRTIGPEHRFQAIGPGPNQTELRLLRPRRVSWSYTDRLVSNAGRVMTRFRERIGNKFRGSDGGSFLPVLEQVT